MKAAIFDLDGTLIDSLGVWDQVDRTFLADRGFKGPDNLTAIIKNMSFSQAAEYFIERFALSETVEQLIKVWTDMAYEEYAHNIQLKPGVREYLFTLKQREIKLGIATASERNLTEAVLSRYGLLELFQTVVTVSEMGKGKEEPEIFLAVASKLGIAPQNCRVFEDSIHGARSAKKAGMQVYAVYDAYSAHETAELKLLSDRYILDFWELKEDK